MRKTIGKGAGERAGSPLEQDIVLTPIETEDIENPEICAYLQKIKIGHRFLK